MAEKKTNCTKCGVEILQSTADRTTGLCMPCKLGRPPQPDPNEPVEVSCLVSSNEGPHPIFFVSAQDLLQQLEAARHVGDSSHPNKLELEAQRALLRHCIRHRANFRLNDDHWGRTGYSLLTLFEQGKATMQVDGRQFLFTEITKEDWKVVRGPLWGHGGFLYRDAEGNVVFKIGTWVS